MTIVIDTPINPAKQHFGYDHEPNTEIRQESNEAFLDEVLGNPKRFHYSSRNKLQVAIDGNGTRWSSYQVPTVSLGIQALHQCFATHVPFSLSPDIAWYLIVHEVAEYVKQNANRHAHLFTETPGEKQLIEVHDDSLRYDEPSDWQRSINLIRGPLTEKLTDVTMELFLPDFSTSTLESSTTTLVAFMDIVSPYYEFRWATMCGIPQIQLEGTAADWHKVVSRTEQLATQFDGLGSYFADLIPVLGTIADTANGGSINEEWWRSIYKYNDQSGGPFVSGWITTFFAHIQTPEGAKLKENFDWTTMAKRLGGGYSTNAFPSHMSRVPFIWDYLGTKYDMAFAAGVFGVDEKDGFLSPQLGFAVLEV